jgi:hypothetical protein
MVSGLLLEILIKNKYFIYIINKIINIICLLKDLVYTCNYREIITLMQTIVINKKNMIIYHVFNIYIVENHSHINIR